MAKTSLASMSVDDLLKLRDDIVAMLGRKADELQSQLSRLRGDRAAARSSTPRAAKASRRGGRGKKVAPKYRGPAGETWSGRGLKPRWLTAQIKSGRKLDDFLIEAGGRKQGRRKKAT